MKWEELKVYKSLSKEELKPAFKHFTKVIADNLQPLGFSQKGRMLVSVSNDVLHIIHIDTRGSWSGITEHFNIQVSIVSTSDKSPFIRNMGLTGFKNLDEIAIGIRDWYRITKEYELLADFLTRAIIKNVIPYFNKYENSQKILDDRSTFKFDKFTENNENLILFSELQNQINIDAEFLIDKKIAFFTSLNPQSFSPSEYSEELEILKVGLQTNNWDLIDQKLLKNKIEVFRKLKLKI